IGKAIAIALAATGAKLILFDLADASETAAQIHSHGGKARNVQGNVSSEPDILKLFAEINRVESRLDITVNCAGIQLIRPLLETTTADLESVVATNLKGTFLVGRESARIMQREPPGSRIINIASELAYTGRAKFSAYCATKGAILSLTRSWARELAPHIRVNAVAPGPTDTQMVSLDCLTPEELKEESNIPLQRIAKPEEIAATVVFLAGPGATYFTGQCLSPNGGAVMF
ncbi:MAG TPA: SDR family oxidoreductase, partial [Tepidisphaeraceae bacterium]